MTKNETAIDAVNQLQTIIETVYLNSYAESTARIYIPCLGKVCSYIKENLNFIELSHDDIVTFINHYQPRLAPSTINNYIRQFRCLTRLACKAGIFKTDPCKSINNLKLNTKSAEKPPFSKCTHLGCYASLQLCQTGSSAALIKSAPSPIIFKTHWPKNKELSQIFFVEQLSVANRRAQPTLATTTFTKTETKGKHERSVTKPKQVSGLHWLRGFLIVALSSIWK
ncbi:phage integrase SAM-like domain-containing protein [Vibrio comitans]